MIFTINLNEFRQMATLEQGIVCYYETESKIELYLIKPGISVIFKSVYIKRGDENDLIWKDDNLKKALRIIDIDKGDISFKIVRE
jgi:hypothetical protein